MSTTNRSKYSFYWNKFVLGLVFGLLSQGLMSSSSHAVEEMKGNVLLEDVPIQCDPLKTPPPASVVGCYSPPNRTRIPPQSQFKSPQHRNGTKSELSNSNKNH